MNLSDQCVSLELAKRLHELGVNQVSLFYWDAYKNINEEHDLKYIIPENHIAAGYRKFYMKDKHHYSAFTCAELGEMLPKSCFSFKGDYESSWECVYERKDGYNTTSGGKTEADARARLLIHLLENNIIKLEKSIGNKISED